jgi:primosomal protein N' (replication factor Y)
LRCERCEAGLAYNRSLSGLRCPRCSWTGSAPDVCPNCGASDFRFLGAGSERLAEQVASAFPKARVTRVDPDVLGRTGPASLEGDIYLTTWIGAKEILRPEVSLVGVLSIDPLIRRPDFRAAERAYRVLAEMSEWAGAGGRLVVQTGGPSHHAVQAVVRGDHGFFVTREIEQRRELKYPPFSELVKVTVAGAGGTEVIEEIVRIARGTDASVLGPIPVPLSDFGDDVREVLIKSPDAMTIADALRPTAESAPAGIRLRIDVDPR